jgi:hypothetical protein
MIDALPIATIEKRQRTVVVDRMDLTGNSTLLIRPLIKQIKFLSTASRVFAGPAGGSGVVVMDTAYVDGATGEVLANPGYLRKAGAWSSTVLQQPLLSNKAVRSGA